jgi:hypothetical protein
MKGLDFIIKKTTTDLKMETKQEDVKKLLTAFWKEAEQQMIHFDSTTIAIKKLGVFTISKLKVRNFISETIMKIRKTEKSVKYSEGSKKEIIETQKKRLRNALKHRNILAIDYAEKFGNI